MDDETEYDTDEFDDDDYQEFVDREFGGEVKTHRPIWIATAVIVLAAILWATLLPR